MKPSTVCSQITRRALFCNSLAAGLLAGTGNAQAADPIIVASKIDTEGALLGSLIAASLRAHGLPVTTRLQLGPTSICRAALRAGAVDIYPEYTGNGANFFHRAGDPAWHDPQTAYRLAQSLDAPNGITWLPAAPASNGWGIALRNDGGSGGAGTAHPALKSLIDLAKYLAAQGHFRLAASVEFVESPDALPAFEQSYGFRLNQNQLITLAGGNTAATLRAAAEGLSGINAGMAYSTDGALDALGLVLLTDPHHAQIAFQPCPVLRTATLQAHPEIATILAPVFAALTLPALRRMNAQIAADGADPAQVAAQFLARAT